MAVKLICAKHPKYKAERKPASKCGFCLATYLMKQEKPWALIQNVKYATNQKNA